MKIENLNINISDNDGNLKNLDEIIFELEKYYNQMSTHAMSERVIYLQGQKDMMLEILTYLKRI